MEENNCVHRRSTSEAKIALFRSLFRGREDLYSRRFVNYKTGLSGYAPACANEWLQGVCEKPRIKCARCQHQQFLPVTDDAVRRHLAGSDPDGREFVMGIYPMLLDESCFFLSIDLNKADWQDHASLFLATCRRLDLPAALERSRSGESAHIWFFFGESVPAMLARKLGSYVLTESMERAPGIGLDAYDRFCPSQDTLPLGSFGSLIALPLQKRAREVGNSVFLDDDLFPFSDQWAFLSSIRRMSRLEVEQVVGSAEGGRIVGVQHAMNQEEELAGAFAAPRRNRLPTIRTIDVLPSSLDIVFCNEILVEKQGLPPAVQDGLIRLAAFQNPEFARAQAMRLFTYGKPRIVSCAQEYPHHIGLPRGCLEQVVELLTDLNVLTDHPRRTLSRQTDRRHISRRAQTRPASRRGRNAGPRHGRAVLATTAFGKTVIGRMAYRETSRQHIGTRASAATAGSMGRAALDAIPPGLAEGRDRPDRRRDSKTNGCRRCRDRPELGSQGRRQGIREALWAAHRR